MEGKSIIVGIQSSDAGGPIALIQAGRKQLLPRSISLACRAVNASLRKGTHPQRKILGWELISQQHMQQVEKASQSTTLSTSKLLFQNKDKIKALSNRQNK